MPNIVVKEKLNQIFYSSYIADSRPKGIAPGKGIFDNRIRLFADIGDPARTNVRFQPMPGEQTAKVKSLGIFTSLSDEEDDALCDDDTWYKLSINGEDISIARQSLSRYDGCTTRYDGCTKLSVYRPRKEWVIINPRDTFFVEISSGEEFTKKMRKIETGGLCRYAEITAILEVTLTREVQ